MKKFSEEKKLFEITVLIKGIQLNIENKNIQGGPKIYDVILRKSA